MNLEFDEIEKIMRFFDESSASELKLETPDVKFVLRRASLPQTLFSQNVSDESSTALPAEACGHMTGAEKDAAGNEKTKKASERTETHSPQSTENLQPQNLQSEEHPQQEGMLVTAPLAGIFYRSPKPGDKPFVEAGTQVKKGQTIGLMEAMKIINEVPAPCDGTVTEILAADGVFAEYEAPLIRIAENG